MEFFQVQIYAYKVFHVSLPEQLELIPFNHVCISAFYLQNPGHTVLPKGPV